MAFEVFPKHRAPDKIPSITVSSSKAINLSDSAFDALGRPKKVLLLFDREANAVGVKAAGPEDFNGYSVLAVGKGSQKITAHSFCDHYGLVGETRRYPAKMVAGVLVAQLDQGNQVHTSARGRRGEPI